MDIFITNRSLNWGCLIYGVTSIYCDYRAYTTTAEGSVSACEIKFYM